MSFTETWLIVLSILVLIQQWQLRATTRLAINLARAYLALVRGHVIVHAVGAAAPDEEKQA